MIYELLLIIGLPLLVMALAITVQPLRFDILEELGCVNTVYSYVGYVIYYGPAVVTSLGCAVLAPLTLRTFLRHRKEMNEFLTSSPDLTRNKYNRLMVIACLDTIFNVPILFIDIITTILQGKDASLNYPYISWKNVHDGAGGNFPGLSLSSIVQIPASEWSTNGWDVFTVKWNAWVYVLHALIFFSVFGTTPEMRNHYRTAFWFVPERLGYKRQRVTEVETVSDVAFNSNPAQQAGNRAAGNRRHGSLSFLETTIDTGGATHSVGFGATGELGVTTDHHAFGIVSSVEGAVNQAVSSI